MKIDTNNPIPLEGVQRINQTTILHSIFKKGLSSRKQISIETGLDTATVSRSVVPLIENGIIEDAKFKTYGCGSAIASSSLVTEMLKGRTLDEAQAIKNTSIVEELALPPVKIHCSVLAEDAIKAAVADLKSKKK